MSKRIPKAQVETAVKDEDHAETVYSAFLIASLTSLVLLTVMVGFLAR